MLNVRLTLCERQKKLKYEVPHLKLATRRRVDKLQVNEFCFCVLQSAGFAGQVLQVDPISVIANNYNIYERSRGKKTSDQLGKKMTRKLKIQLNYSNGMELTQSPIVSKC